MRLFDRDVDLLIERLPIIERTDTQKLQERVELLNIVLPGGMSCQSDDKGDTRKGVERTSVYL